ncbi:MAG: hypothetical protein C0405_14050, partial [Desulfovibrio sp.]|nr:hypothetical protein [Desulfovibrio sp.]
ALPLLWPAPAWAGSEQDSRPVMAVQGRATLELVPDKVEMTVGVSTQAPTSAEAARQNALAMEQVLGAVKARLGTAGTLQSLGYRVNQRYDWDGKRNRPAGYTAVNQVKVTLKDVKQAGTLLDEATQAGANVVFGPTWGLVDMSTPRIQVQEAALADAQAQARALARAAGLSLGQLKSADFSPGDGPRPMMAPAPAMAARAAPETPVEPGVISLSATVRCVWYLQ